MTVMEAIRTRRSVRAYNPIEIPGDVLAQMKDAIRLAPSACNFQPWKFILVTDAQIKEQLVEAARGWKWIADAPVVVVAVGIPHKCFKKMGGYRVSVDVDVAIAMDHLTLAAVEAGLGTCWIGAFDEDRVKALLKIPHDARVVAITPLGQPAKSGLNHPDADNRKPAEEIFCINTYS